MVKLEAKRENLSTHIQFLIPISIKKIFRLKHFSFFFGGIKVVIILILKLIYFLRLIPRQQIFSGFPFQIQSF